MAVVGLSGLKGAGKDEAAKPLIEQGWKKLAFADPLREMLYTLNPIVKMGPPMERAFAPMGQRQEYTRWQEYLDVVGYDEAKKHTEVRRLMQVFGTDVMREMYRQDAWVDLAERTIEADPYQDWVLTDVRFDDEAEMVRRQGGCMIRIQRNGLVADGHQSEEGVRDDLVDVIMPNNGTVDSLHRQMRSVVDLVGQLRRAE